MKVVERKIPDTLVTRIAEAYGYHIGAASAVAPSDGAVVWRADAERPLFIHQGPPWRTSEELAWVHQLVTRVAATLPEAVAPLSTRAGGTFVEHDGALVALYPFIDGVHLDREAAAQRDAAAQLLARLHRALLSCEVPARPQPGPHSPWAALAQLPVPPDLEDRALDDWRTALLGGTDLPRGLVHGDYYRRNVLSAGGRVVAVVDWHEAHHDLLLAEVASAAWEPRKDAMSRSFSSERARAFLDAYADAGGPANVRDRSLIVPLIRWRLRVEALLEARGAVADRSYREAMTTSFNALRSRSL